MLAGLAAMAMDGGGVAALCQDLCHNCQGFGAQGACRVVVEINILAHAKGPLIMKQEEKAQKKI